MSCVPAVVEDLMVCTTFSRMKRNKKKRWMGGVGYRLWISVRIVELLRRRFTMQNAFLY